MIVIACILRDNLVSDDNNLSFICFTFWLVITFCYIVSRASTVFAGVGGGVATIPGIG